MFRANVYSLEPLSTEVRQGIHQGLDIIAGYMGQKVAAREFYIQLPHDEQGLIQPEHVSFKDLDRRVELHLMAVPLHPGKVNRLGAASEFGKALVHSGIQSMTVARIATAHEVAHSFGFIRALSQHAHPEDPFHCGNSSCIMHPILIGTRVMRYAEQKHPVQRFMNKMLGVQEHMIEEVIYDQKDFCDECKKDMRTFGHNQLELLHHMRDKKLLPID